MKLAENAQEEAFATLKLVLVIALKGFRERNASI